MALGLFPEMTAACALLALAQPALAQQASGEAPNRDASSAAPTSAVPSAPGATSVLTPVPVPVIVTAAAAQERAMRPLPPVEIGAPPPVPPPASPPIPEPVPGGRTATPCTPQSLRWTEDWTCLANPAKRTSPLEALRYLPLGDDPEVYLSIGGEARYNYTYWSALNLGAKGKDKLSALQQRLRLVADLHLGRNVRAFLELGDNREFFETFATPPNRDKLDINQAFIDVTLPLGDTTKLTLRPGRFEMPIGNGKLVGLRDGVNVRYVYQGIRGTLIEEGKVRVDAFAVKPVTFEPGMFDDGPENGRHFNGVYVATAPGLLAPNLAVDLYWYDLYRENARYTTLTGTESRQSWGLRLSGRASGFDWDAEGTYQSGSFAGQKIQAWGMLLEGGYTFADLPMKPRLGGRFNWFSGDDDPNDGKIGTFAPPFPRTPLYSDAGWLNMSNLIDVTPTLTLKPSKKLTLVGGPELFWRATAADAVYAGPTNFPLLRPTDGGRFVGTGLNLQADYLATKNLSFHAYFTHFIASDSLQSGGGRSSDYFGFWADFRF
ncbi:alginate export protein [Novosphingobium sp. PhB55]|uniref:alginate export family protein n=1 Tax=unclassified Novosphingobium TaxID=2644732 RepID=UPI0010E3DD75|nr:alginate export family protein [Novosphingobium sp. PhB55]TDW64322.1 alginate export protein [Novosphingobium sp. PhB55]